MLRSILHSQGAQRELSPSEWPELIERADITGVIFDCDGTLVESAEGHLRAMQAAADDQGQVMPREWYGARTGLDRCSLFTEFATTIAGPFDVARACRVSIERFGGFAHLVHPIEEVADFAAWLKARGLPRIVATNAERAVADVSLTATGLLPLFDGVVTISDAVPPKPAPDMFIKAAHLMGQPQDRVLVLEDSPQGVSAGLAAGMQVLQVLS